MNRFVLLSLFLFFTVLLAGCLNQSAETPSANETYSQDAPLANQVKFTCENDDNGIETRGYVLLMGYSDHNKFGWDVEKYYMQLDPLAQFTVIYDQDEQKHLPEISEKFLADMRVLLHDHPVDELVIFGASAGGVTASYSISKLNFSGSIAIHTLSSPLKGYGFPKEVLGNRKGFMLDIASGLPRYEKPGSNVKVYHHKTVTDTILVDHYCNGFEFLCNAVEIQNNNIEESKEFFYSQYDHNPLMKFVIPKVLKCYNVALETALPQELAIGFGELCTGEDNCRLFCLNNMGLCRQYCTENQRDELCGKILNSNGGLNPQE